MSSHAHAQVASAGRWVTRDPSAATFASSVGNNEDVARRLVESMRDGQLFDGFDAKCGSWYACKCVARNVGAAKPVRIHFLGWSKAHDTWVSLSNLAPPRKYVSGNTEEEKRKFAGASGDSDPRKRRKHRSKDLSVPNTLGAIPAGMARVRLLFNQRQELIPYNDVKLLRIRAGIIVYVAWKTSKKRNAKVRRHLTPTCRWHLRRCTYVVATRCT